MTELTHTPAAVPAQRPGISHPEWDSVDCQRSRYGDLVHWEVPGIFVPSNGAEPLVIGRVRCDEVDGEGRQTVHETEVAIGRLDGSVVTVLPVEDIPDLCAALRSLSGLD